ncbi:MAG: hypothetical protein IAG10_02030 [Planctomycetaceae bacterium]|nr:hypothetical protein [Planctomycetaceae bacterium]
MNLDLHHPANAKLLASFSGSQLPPIASPDSVKNPYFEQGSHPDIVERVWDQLGKGFPPEAQCLLFGSPALVDPENGIVVAVAYGTAYVVRIPVSAVAEAMGLRARTTMQWSFGKPTDIQELFGDDWIFGAWLNQEAAWCRQASQEVSLEQPDGADR